MSDFIFGDLAGWVESVIDALGYFGVGLLVFLENLFPPIPSEVVLPAAGLYAERNGGLAPLVGMAVVSTVGSVVGAWLLYAGAAWIGPDRLRAFAVRRGRWLGVKDADVDRAEAWFDDRGQVAVLVCRCIPLVRSLISIPAGFRRMPAGRFTLYTVIGSAVWNTALILVGYAASSYQHQVETALSYLQYAVVAALAGGVAWFLWRRNRPSQASGHTDPDRAEELV